jgi:HK97 family phage major capsid protein
MPVLADLKHNMRDLALKAHAIVEDEKLSGPEKREALDKYDVDIKALSEEIKTEEYLVEQRKSLGGIIGAETPAEETEEAQNMSTKSLGEQLVAHPEFKAISGQIGQGGQFSSGVIDLKATFTESGLGSSNVIAQDRQPGVLPILFQRLTIADLMPNGTTSSNVVRYVVESTATNAASTVAEGGLKPEAALNLTVVDEAVKKIAVILKVTDEMLEDLDQAASYVNGRLSLFVRQREEQQLLTGNASALSSNLTGILNRGSLTAADPVGSETYGKIALAIHREITKIRVASFLDPDAIVFHPNDWQQARFEADANGQFFGGGPFTGAYGQGGIAGDTYWGLRTVVTQAMTENTALLGAFSTAAQIFRRNNITVTMTNSNEDDFKNNLVAVRAEERLALAVYRPAAFGTVTGI